MSEVKELVKKWAMAIGPEAAVGRLVTRGVSPRAAERLCVTWDYPSEPKAIREKLLDEMSKDGFSLAATGGVAS